jgi:hypothetical protein
MGRIVAINQYDKEHGSPKITRLHRPLRRNLTLATDLAALWFGSRKTVALRAVSTGGSVIASSTTAPSALIASVVPFFRRCLFFFGRH